MEWLDGFESMHGRLQTKLVNQGNSEPVQNLGKLVTRGVPSGDYEWRAPFTSDFSEWERSTTARYLAGFRGIRHHTEQHDIWTFRHGRSEFLVPALVLLRGIFPLIPEAFEYLFSPRNLEALCVPLVRNGHWSVALPDFRGVYKGRFRTATVESLTWASLFPSARELWVSTYRNACEGRMSLSLPKAKIRMLPLGIHRDSVVHVTSVTVSAVLALEKPLDFASEASRSFLWNRNAIPLAPNPNAYYEQSHPLSDAANLALTDEEWAVVGPLCSDQIKPTTGRRPRDSRRDIANGLLVRLATARLWKEIATAPLTPRTLEDHWYQWRKTGRLDALITSLRVLRPDADYLKP